MNCYGLFCLFSSGIQKSYEDIVFKYGYFTEALLKAFAKLRKNDQANCHDIVKIVSHHLKSQDLPLPEAYHIGSEDIWPLGRPDKKEFTIPFKNLRSFVQRGEALAQLQDFLVTFPDPIIWMWGDEGLARYSLLPT